jgi:hypothetical protein
MKRVIAVLMMSATTLHAEAQSIMGAGSASAPSPQERAVMGQLVSINTNLIGLREVAAQWDKGAQLDTKKACYLDGKAYSKGATVDGKTCGQLFDNNVASAMEWTK